MMSLHVHVFISRPFEQEARNSCEIKIRKISTSFSFSIQLLRSSTDVVRQSAYIGLAFLKILHISVIYL